MIKKLNDKVKLIFILTLMIFTIVGCENTAVETGEPQALAVVVGEHANAPSMLNSPSVRQAIYDTAYDIGSISITNNDGAPKLLYSGQVEDYPVKGLSESRKIQITNDKVSLYMSLIAEYSVPQVPEVNTLEAISLAGEQLISSNYTNKLLLIADSGIQTTGYFDIVDKDLFNTDKELIIRTLEQQYALPKLDGIDVLWYSCGEVYAPQESLSKKQEVLLKSLWESILLAAGANSVTFYSETTNTPPSDSYPLVTTVNVESISNDYLEWGEYDEILETEKIPQAKLSFLPDSAEFIDINMAKDTLSTYADALKSKPLSTIYVAGTTAGGSNYEYARELSEKRAEAVANLLCALGVNESQLISIGLGFESEFYQYDINIDGSYIENIAELNRSVLLIDTKHVDARKVESFT